MDVLQHASWTRSKVLFTALAFRLALVLYSNIHDYIFEVPFTDIDYRVFSDAAAHVANGRSPFARDTYRYTPALAWLLVPNVRYANFGKCLFCIVDVFVGWLLLELLSPCFVGQSVEEKKRDESWALRVVGVFWLANPFTAVISSRGNAEALVLASVLLSLLLLKQGRWVMAALVHGALAMHLKIYPVIYLPSIYLWLSVEQPRAGPGEEGWAQTVARIVKRLIVNPRGILFAIISLGSFAALVVFFYSIYNHEFLEEYLLYHAKRRDVRHNFSPYFYPLYLAEGNEELSRFVGWTAFVPQATCIVFFALRHFDDLPFCWFITTFSFVALNKVCTSQYFVWYLVLLPLVWPRLQMHTADAFVLLCLWLFGQGQWLLPAYLFEFRGWRTLEWIGAASMIFLLINFFILHELLVVYKREEELEEEKTKKDK